MGDPDGDEITEAPLSNVAPSLNIEEQNTDEEPEQDIADQIVFMFDKLKGKQRRITIEKLRPIVTSTFLDITEKHEDKDNQKLEEKHERKTNSAQSDGSQQSTIHTSNGEITLSAGTSKIHITTGNASQNFTCKLRAFSGILPTPNGQVDFRTWMKAANRLVKDKGITDAEKLGRIQNSLLKPALDVVESSLDDGSIADVMRILQSLYGSVDDPRDLMIRFNSMVQDPKEKASEYLSRLYLAMDDLLRQNIVKIRDGNSQLFQQFLYGCHDDTLIMKLRLEEKQDYPDYGALLLDIRKEEAKRTRRQMTMKLAKAHQLTTEDTEVEKLRKEVATLKQQSAEVESLRYEMAQLKQQNSSRCNNETEIRPPDRSKQEKEKNPEKKKLGFCFKCGLDGHKIWNCRGKPNPELVCKRFEDNQGN